ncbi:MAG TPA: hypothetical protein VKA21_05940 [Candidatus Binatia bacterium]|nr:hypothetical protein [Candidatus Binatia bacterium]
MAAAVCTTDAECDNGDTCSTADQCLVAVCVLGGGGDANDDLVCDDELDGGTTFNLTRLVLRRRNSLRSDNSAAKGGGDLFISGSPAGAFTGTDGISIRLKDALSSVPPTTDGIDVSVSWAPEECTVKSTGVVSCKSLATKNFAKFKPNPIAPSQFKFTFKLKALGDLQGPFFGPVRMVLSRGDRRSSDVIEDCQLILAGLRCREF